MTNEKLEELKSIKDEIDALKVYLDCIEGSDYDYFEISGVYKNDANMDHFCRFNNMEKHKLHPLAAYERLTCDGLQEAIISFLKEKLAKLEKEFEEA